MMPNMGFMGIINCIQTHGAASCPWCVCIVTGVVGMAVAGLTAAGGLAWQYRQHCRSRTESVLPTHTAVPDGRAARPYTRLSEPVVAGNLLSARPTATTTPQPANQHGISFQ